MPLDLIDKVRSFPLFQSTPESFLIEVGLRLRPQLHSANDYILTEGDDAKAMYWLVRGAVSVTSRDGESVYAELKPGAFFGEIGILMDRPRTATIVARTRCLVLVLKKEDLAKILPSFPEVERCIRDEAQERLTILERKKKESQGGPKKLDEPMMPQGRRASKRLRDYQDEMQLDGGDVPMTGMLKKRKSPSPSHASTFTTSALASGTVNVRLLLKELPLFSNLPPDILHFLGLNAQPKTYPPFTNVIEQDSQGREVFFIVKGEVEVLDEKIDTSESESARTRGARARMKNRPPQVKARLRHGQYFGEVVSLSLAPRRTATVRTVTSVECLVLSGEVLAAFWERCPESTRRQVERTAKQRLESASDGDVIMKDMIESSPSIDELMIGDRPPTPKKGAGPRVTFSEAIATPQPTPPLDDGLNLAPSDPDPFLNVGLDNVRSRSRRGSLAPPSPDDSSSDRTSTRTPSPDKSSPRVSTPSPSRSPHSLSQAGIITPRTSGVTRRPGDDENRGVLPKSILIQIFRNLELHHLFRLRAVCLSWSEILTKSPEVLEYLDLSPYYRQLNDEVLVNTICPFIGERPRHVDVSNCFQISDDGFVALAAICGSNVVSWKLKSVWELTAPAILEMSNRSKNLEEVDLSNCRKVSDTLLARIVGWMVPQQLPHQQQYSQVMNNSMIHQSKQAQMQKAAAAAAQSQSNPYPPGTVFGCPRLKRLTLSYCKHVGDRSMHHIAAHAASRIEEMDLTRCTTITDQGFQYWGNAQFVRLKKLCLADCTYLTDNAIVYLTNAAKGLEELDLVSYRSDNCFFFNLASSLTPSLVLLLCSLRHINRSPVPRLSSTSASAPLLLRQRRLRLLSPQYRTAPPTTPRTQRARMRACDRDRR